MIDYEYATVDVDLLVHPKAIAAGVEAMGLWLWSMAWAHKTGSDGRIPRHVLVQAWGATKATLARLTRQLVASGLWLEHEDGFEIWNYSRKNQSAEEKERRRALGRERMKRLRARRSSPPAPTPSDASRDAHVRDECAAPAPDLISSGISLIEKIPEETPSAREGDDDQPPAWFVAAAATVEQTTGRTVDELGARWLEYRAARERKGWPQNARDAVAWLSAVLRSETSRGPLRARARPQDIVQPAIPGSWVIPEAMP